MNSVWLFVILTLIHLSDFGYSNKFWKRLVFILFIDLHFIIDLILPIKCVSVLFSFFKKIIIIIIIISILLIVVGYLSSKGL